MFRRSKGIKLRPEHAEHALAPRVVTAAMAWSAGLALGVATGDIFVSLILTLVITSGHVVSWRTRTWRNARWQTILLIPTTLVAILLVPSLPAAFQGDWLHPMRYLLLLQALTSFYLHSRASLYTAQVLSAIVLMVSSQLSFDSVFLVFFFLFFLMQIVFLSVVTRTDAFRAAVGIARWPSSFARYGWSAAGVLALGALSLLAFMLLPWGSLSAVGSGSSMMPLTGEALDGQQQQQQGQGELPENLMPLTGAAEPKQPDPEQPGQQQQQDAPQAAQLPQELWDDLNGSESPSGSGTQLDGSSLGDSGLGSPAFGTEDGLGGGVLGESGQYGDQANPVIMQVRSPVATYWRGLAYPLYDGEYWLPDPRVSFSPPERTLKHRYAQTFFVRGDVEMPAFGYTPLGWQPVGIAEPPYLQDGDVYRVISERRNFFPAALQRAPRNNVVNRGPDSLIPQRVHELANEITADSYDALTKSLAITQYLRTNYQNAASVNPWVPAQTMEQFLFGDHKIGNAFDFASAQTALATAAGLEARLVTGYLPGDLDPLSGTYVVQKTDAHAWTEINFGGRVGWVPFDGNPREDGQARAPVQSGAASAIAGLFSKRVGDQVRDTLQLAVQETIDLLGRMLGPIAIGVLVVGSVMAVRWWFGRRKRVDPYTLLIDGDRRSLIASYEKLMRQVRKHVAPRDEGETVDQYFGRVAHAYPWLWEDLSDLRQVVNRAAYDGGDGTVLDYSRATAKAAAIRESIRAAARA